MATAVSAAASSDKIGWCAPVYVGDTDESAIAEARPHIEAMFNVFLPKVSELMFFPPGYMSNASLKNILAHKPAARYEKATIEGLIEKGILVCGSPKTVLAKLTAAHHEMGFQEFLTLLQFGTMPGNLAEKNIRLFAAEVLPALKGLTDREYRGFETKTAVAAE